MQLKYALAYSDLGLPVFPCEAGGKKPATRHGCRDATTGPEQIRAWWSNRPYNIGLATGSGGVHYFFRCDDPALTVGVEFVPGLDYRGTVVM